MKNPYPLLTNAAPHVITWNVLLNDDPEAVVGLWEVNFKNGSLAEWDVVRDLFGESPVDLEDHKPHIEMMLPPDKTYRMVGISHKYQQFTQHVFGGPYGPAPDAEGVYRVFLPPSQDI